MDDPALPPLPPPTGAEFRVDPPKPSLGQRIKKALGPVGVAIVALFGKLKLVIVPIIKFLPVFLKTGGTMILSTWVYAMAFGWPFAAGLVLLIFVHECGHLLAAKLFGLKVSAPMFIPFMGAFIALKEAPRDAWMEACVGIGGPILGTIGACASQGLYLLTGNPLFEALAYVAFLLNLFNLVPIGFLDGGRIATALSPWMWVGGVIIMGAMAWIHPTMMRILILVLSLPRLLFLFRRKTEEEKRYFEVTPARRWTMAVMYFGLVAFLFVSMRATYHVPMAQ
ncbi:MAG TPA: site-2 protease family protein [Opitutaceae bacterium]|nr:site-2 protease family protein [Opitutaceae bacterium]